MKILYLGLGRVNKNNKDGGAIRFFELSKIFHSLGVEQKLITTVREQNNLDDYGTPFEKFYFSDPAILKDSALLLYVWRTIRACALCIRYKEEFHIVYSLSDFFHDVLPALFYKLTHKKCYWTVNVFLVQPPLGKRYETIYAGGFRIPSARSLFSYIFQRISVSLAKNFADKVFVLNSIDKETLMQWGLKSDQVDITCMGVDKHSMGVKSRKIFDAVYLGRFHPQKGIEDILPIWKYVLSQKRNAKLVVIGGGSNAEITSFKDSIVRNGRKKIHFRHGHFRTENGIPV